jgi:hemerythrin-like domain-containing protein
LARTILINQSVNPNYEIKNKSLIQSIISLSSRKNLKKDHTTIKRVRNIAQKCSNKLYSNKEVPLIVEEFIDNFHHGKEE